MEIYIADYHDYDARGGSGEPYSTLDLAKASFPGEIEWDFDEGFDQWTERSRHDYGPHACITRHTLDGAAE